jgi:hypothetical protein
VALVCGRRWSDLGGRPQRAAEIGVVLDDPVDEFNASHVMSATTERGNVA